MIHVEVELINGADLSAVRRGEIGKDGVKQTRVKMLVDPGTVRMSINQQIQKVLQIPLSERVLLQLTNGVLMEFDIVAPVEVRYGNRRSICRAIVLPGEAEPLLGIIPLQDMAIMVDPRRQELVAQRRRL